MSWDNVSPSFGILLNQDNWRVYETFWELNMNWDKKQNLDFLTQDSLVVYDIFYVYVLSLFSIKKCKTTNREWELLMCTVSGTAFVVQVSALILHNIWSKYTNWLGIPQLFYNLSLHNLSNENVTCTLLIYSLCQHYLMLWQWY